jgi:pSer/pThr/pTyr-binding forkhead associated (FHA) protein
MNNGGGMPHSPAPPPAAAPMMGSAGPTLFLIYNGQRYPVTKDQFIIGRGSKTSDLPIKDGNISRKHAAVIRRNGTFYIKDLGSTNGIDYKGMRIDNKRIDEGDVFHLCDYELRFTYRAD